MRSYDLTPFYRSTVRREPHFPKFRRRAFQRSLRNGPACSILGARGAEDLLAKVLVAIPMPGWPRN